jgi:hypothetical protein
MIDAIASLIAPPALTYHEVRKKFADFLSDVVDHATRK